MGSWVPGKEGGGEGVAHVKRGEEQRRKTWKKEAWKPELHEAAIAATNRVDWKQRAFSPILQ